MKRFTPLVIEAARVFRHAPGDRRFGDETYAKVAGGWRYVYRAVDQFGHTVDVYVSTKRDTPAAIRSVASAIGARGEPAEVTADRADALARAIAELQPAALHDTEQYANSRVEADHGRLKARLRAMRGLKRDRSCRVIIPGYALIQNLRRCHYELGATQLHNS